MTSSTGTDRATRDPVACQHEECIVAGEAAETAGATPAVATRRRDLFTDRGFVLVWSVGTLTSTARWLEMLAVAVYVFDLTSSPFLVAAMTILRMLPLALFGAFAGAIAERANRRTILALGLAVMVVVSVCLGVLAWLEEIELWHVGLGAFVGGMYWITDLPARRTMLADIAGPHRLGAAIGLDTVTNNGTRMLGPTLGGLLLEILGMHGAYFLSAALHGAGLLAVLALPRPPPSLHDTGSKVLGAVVEGLRLLRRDRTLAGVLVVTLIFNVFGFPMVSMIPVIGRDVLGLTAFPVGLLTGVEGAGAMIGAILITAFAPMRHFRRLYFFGVVVYLALALAFAQSSWVAPCALFLFGVGIGGAAFSSMQSTLVMLNSPPSVRSRMMGVLSVCIGSGPLGFLHVGLLADWFGASTAITVIAVEGLVALAIAHRVWPELHDHQPPPG